MRPDQGSDALEPMDWVRYWTEEADRAAAQKNRELQDRASNLIGWAVAVLAGLLSLAGFEMFGDAMAWPPLTVPWRSAENLSVKPMVLLWFTVDLLALISMRQWLNPAYDDDTRQLGKWVSAGALTVSVLINVTGHLLAGGPHPWAAVPASALPPALLWCVLFLRDRRVRDQASKARKARTAYDERAKRAADRAEQASHIRSTPGRTGKRTTTDRAVAHQTAADNPDRTDEALLTRLLALDQRYGRTVGKHTAARELRIGTERYLKLRAMAANRMKAGADQQ